MSRRTIVVGSLLVATSCTSASDQTTRQVAGGTAVATTPAPPTPSPSPNPNPTPSPDASATPSQDASPTPISPALLDYAAAMRAADWARWPGLPAELRERDLLRTTGVDRARTTRSDARLGHHDAIVVDAGGLRYWLRDRDRVVLVQLTGDLAGTAAPAELLAALGKADREGPGRFLQSGATTTEHVFAGRGLAVTVAASYDTPPSFAPRVAAVQLFAPTDLRTFVLELGGNDRGGPSGPRR